MYVALGVGENRAGHHHTANVLPAMRGEGDGAPMTTTPLTETVWCEHFTPYRPAEWGWPSGNQCRQPATLRGDINGLTVRLCARHSDLYAVAWKPLREVA
jgi:hypothetical protein